MRFALLALPLAACSVVVYTDTDVGDDTAETDSAGDTDGSTDTSGAGDTPDTQPDVVRGVVDLAPGDLLLVEVLHDPTACADADGEYVELRNTSSTSIDLNGLVIADGTSRQTINEGRIAPGGRFVIGKSGVPNCYGLTPGEALSLSLNNEGERFALLGAGDLELDAVDTSTFTLSPGVAVERADADPTVWCDATDVIGGTGDLGTPGAGNGACGAGSTGGGPSSGGSGTSGGSGSGGSGGSGGGSGTTTAPGALRAGDVIFTEVMANPGDGCDDNDGEYVEVRNASANRVDLSGVVIEDNSGSFAFPSGTTLAAGRFLAVARDPASVQCFGISLFFPTSIQLGNSGETLTLTGPGGTALDDVTYPSADSGMAWMRDDQTADWCDATQSIAGSANFGTPGAANGSCP